MGKPAHSARAAPRAAAAFRSARNFLPAVVFLTLAGIILAGVAHWDFSSFVCAAVGTAYLLDALAVRYLARPIPDGSETRVRRCLRRLVRLFETGAAVFFTFFLIVQIVLQAAVTQAKPPPGFVPDVVVVFGAAVRSDAPTPTLSLRIRKAYECLNLYPDAMAVVSGGLGTGERRSEAEIMAEELRRLGIAESRIILEPRSRDTRENVAYSLALIRETYGSGAKILAVSNGLHLYRIRSLFAAQGVSVYACPAPHPNAGAALSLAVREVFSVLNLWLGHPV